VGEQEDRRRWDERHARAGALSPASAFVVEHVRRLGHPGRRARALDVACGGGRHSAVLAAAGFSTVALDASPAAVKRTAAVAGVAGVVADAGALPFRAESFDLIVMTCFLERTIVPKLAALLGPRGHLLIETFRLAQHELTGHPRREFCLTDGELESLCEASEVRLEVVAAHRRDPGPGGEPAALAGVVARRG
jgi:SAM-dependent methyltransferase